MRHQAVEAWEERLNELLKQVDQALEAQFGKLLAPHPARPPHGSTANPQHDGLFRITAGFTPGYGSRFGKGYALQLDWVTLQTPDPEQAEAIRKKALAMIQEGLRRLWPDRPLEVKRDGDVWKIVGDLTLSPRRH